MVQQSIGSGNVVKHSPICLQYAILWSILRAQQSFSKSAEVSIVQIGHTKHYNNWLDNFV
jgi:hypothetical protein